MAFGRCCPTVITEETDILLTTCIKKIIEEGEGNTSGNDWRLKGEGDDRRDHFYVCMYREKLS